MSKHNFRMRRIGRIHFIGIGGAGMGGIAEVLITKGYVVTGSDTAHNVMTERLTQLGAQIFDHHHPENVVGADVVVFSSAILPNNPELIAAAQSHILIVRRAEMLAELMRFSYGVAIAGTHGKTTTTSLTTCLLAESGADPTYVIGGKLNSTGTNAFLGEGRYFVAEADESDASFLCLQPMIAVVTNIDQDHMETYGNNYQRLEDAFVEFIHRLPFYGLAVLCADDPGIKAILPRIKRPFTTYGMSGGDWQAVNRRQSGTTSEFTALHHRTKEAIDISLNLVGEHNVLNALAAIAVTRDLNVSPATIQLGLKQFAGVDRRFQLYGEFQHASGSALLIDDYGHHPREVAMVIKAARETWPSRRLVMLYQPHRYSRTRDLFAEFVTVLSDADVVILLDIYSANESPIPGITSERLAYALKEAHRPDVYHIEDIENLSIHLNSILRQGDLFITQGAGDIGRIAKQLATNIMSIDNG